MTYLLFWFDSENRALTALANLTSHCDQRIQMKYIKKEYKQKNKTKANSKDSLMFNKKQKQANKERNNEVVPLSLGDH